MIKNISIAIKILEQLYNKKILKNLLDNLVYQLEKNRSVLFYFVLSMPRTASQDVVLRFFST